MIITTDLAKRTHEVSSIIKQHVIEPAKRQLMFELYVADSITAVLMAIPVVDVPLDLTFESIWADYYQDKFQELLNLVCKSAVVSIKDVNNLVKQNLLVHHLATRELNVWAVRQLFSSNFEVDKLPTRYSQIESLMSIYNEIVHQSGYVNFFIED